MQLSEHFTLEELTASPTAKAKGINNQPPELFVPMLKRVAVELLEPIRAHFGRPVTVNSGYRSPKLNAAIGSKPTSQHSVGEAVDLEVPGVSNAVVAEWVRTNLRFGQLILEGYIHGQPSSGWVHVSLPTRGERNNEVMTATPGSHGMVYRRGLVT